MAPFKVLLVDRDRDSLAIYTLMLEHHGFHVLPASDVSTGLALAGTERPDVVVADRYTLRDGGTLDVPLDRDERMARLPLITLDSAPQATTRVAVRTPRGYELAKPCEPSRLLDAVRDLLAPVVMA